MKFAVCDYCLRQFAVLPVPRLEAQRGRRNQVIDSVFHSLQADILASQAQALLRSNKLEHNISHVANGLDCDMVAGVPLSLNSASSGSCPFFL